MKDDLYTRNAWFNNIFIYEDAEHRLKANQLVKIVMNKLKFDIECEKDKKLKSIQEKQEKLKKKRQKEQAILRKSCDPTTIRSHMYQIQPANSQEELEEIGEAEVHYKTHSKKESKMAKTLSTSQEPYSTNGETTINYTNEPLPTSESKNN